ncbi:MAG: transporter substrate-binding domain-containing protein [Rhodospirillales bacterium]|nr:transporter substrate-binding domain-containing protein [Rhodospirillales bacterium]
MTIFVTPTRREWEEKTIPIRIPIRKGLLGYRLFLIRDGAQSKFSQIKDVQELKNMRVGSGAQWSTTKALQELGFSVTGGTDYEGLFTMLNFGRFDYFPRGVNEIFNEFDTRKIKFPMMQIEEKLALYLPLPTYFFVTPKRPDLAIRLQKGLMGMVADGTLDKLFYEYHGEFLDRANLQNRKIFSLANPDLTKETPFDQKELWLKP